MVQKPVMGNGWCCGGDHARRVKWKEKGWKNNWIGRKLTRTTDSVVHPISYLKSSFVDNEGISLEMSAGRGCQK